MPIIEKKQHAPDFTAVDESGTTIRSDDFLSHKNIILYFYPKDDTSGCTLEAQQFTALSKQFSDANTVVLGVSRDTCQSHQDFISKFGLSVTLLADTSGELCELFGVIQEKEKNGVKSMGIVRSTFVIDAQGIVQEVIYGVKADGHAQAMLEFVQAL